MVMLEAERLFLTKNMSSLSQIGDFQELELVDSADWQREPDTMIYDVTMKN